MARTLNEQGIPTGMGRPWNGPFIAHILHNENYIGNLVYNRQSHKLGARKVSNSPDDWVRAKECFAPIIAPGVFEQVQCILRTRRVEIDEAEMLLRLRRALHKKGRLSETVINSTSGLPHADTFVNHFGSLRHAYRLIGYTSAERDWSYLDTKQAWVDARTPLRGKWRQPSKSWAIGSLCVPPAITFYRWKGWRRVPRRPRSGYKRSDSVARLSPAQKPTSVDCCHQAPR